MFSSSSGDIFCEVMVHHRKGGREAAKTVLVIAACAVGTVLIFFLIPQLIFLMLIAWGWAVYFIRSLDVCYEYILTNDDLDIDVIISDIKRKHKMTVNLRETEEVRPAGEISRIRRGRKLYDYSANDPKMPNYVILFSQNGERCAVLITPNEKLIRRMKNVAPQKIYLT